MAFSIVSPAFKDGEEIPRKHGYKESNINPPLQISDVPQGCKSLALIVDDPDAMGAVGRVWTHWLVWNIEPTIVEIPESSCPKESTEGKTDFGKNAFGGPAPPDKRHTYIFKLYALDTKLDLAKDSDKDALEDAISGHIMQEAKLTGTYAP